MIEKLLSTYLKRFVIYYDLMKASSDQSAGDMLQLFPCLDEEIIPLGNFDWDALSSVTCPDIETRIARTTVNSQEIEVRMETSENGVFLPILGEIRGGRGENMRSIF